jgi:hypothetical protein
MVDKLYNFDQSLFGIDEMPEKDIKAYAERMLERLSQS